jgi:hypothetical protein
MFGTSTDSWGLTGPPVRPPHPLLLVLTSGKRKMEGGREGKGRVVVSREVGEAGR